jgi:hypothetical protein
MRLKHETLIESSQSEVERLAGWRVFVHQKKKQELTRSSLDSFATWNSNLVIGVKGDD